MAQFLIHILPNTQWEFTRVGTIKSNMPEICRCSIREGPFSRWYRPSLAFCLKHHWNATMVRTIRSNIPDICCGHGRENTFRDGTVPHLHVAQNVFESLEGSRSSNQAYWKSVDMVARDSFQDGTYSLRHSLHNS